jgi:hypothetical protein
VPEVSRADIPALVDGLLDPVCDFPFVHDTDRAAYVAAILSIVGRHAIAGPVPAFPVVAPVPGAGKGLLTRVMTLIGAGREPAIMTVPGDDIEFRKRLLVLAIAGTPVVVLDNVSGTIGSDQFAAALTANEFSDRLLGASRLVTAPLTSVWFVTGNNVRFGRTLGRRMVPITLDPENEHPEDRTGFRYPDVIGRVKCHRPTLVTAALALLYGYSLAGKPPHDQPKMGSFEYWDDLVRGAVMWAGLADPAAATDPARGRGRLRAEGDEDLDQLDGLLEALASAFGTSVFQVPDVLTRIETDHALGAACQVAAADRKGVVTANSVGNTFRDRRDRWVRGRKLVKSPKVPGLPRGAWRVQAREATP